MRAYRSDGSEMGAWLSTSSGLVSLGDGGPATPPPSGPRPVTALGRARPVEAGQGVLLDTAIVLPAPIYSWTLVSGGGSLANATTATPTYTAPASGSGVAVARVTVTSGGVDTVADVSIAYGPNIVAAENLLTGTARATWDLASPNFGGIKTLQGFADGFTVDRTGTMDFKIAQSDGAGWTADVYRLGFYSGLGARLVDQLTPTSAGLTASNAQPAPLDADDSTVKLSADCSNWATTLSWAPPAWAASGIYLLRLNRTGGGASHVMFVVRDDARVADLMFMPADSTWHAYNAWGGMGLDQYTGNSLYFGTPVQQYDNDTARFISYDRPIINRGACDAGRTYGAVSWSNFFTTEYSMLRFLESNGYDVKYYGCIDAAGDPNGLLLRDKVTVALFCGHNEYWSDGMRAGWENAKDNGVSVFSSSGNECFWRMVGDRHDATGRPRRFECQKSTINGRGAGRPQWTGTWRDPDGAGRGGDHPENRLTGTIFTVNGPDLRRLVVPVAGGFSASPLWRGTSIAALSTGSWSSPEQILGFEWDTYGPAGVSTTAANYMADPNPSAQYASSSTYAISSGVLLTDAGDVYDAAGTAEHRLVITPSGVNGGITFGSGTVNWSLGLDDANTYQTGLSNVAPEIQQATVNMLCDMGAMPSTLASGLTTPTPVVWF